MRKVTKKKRQKDKRKEKMILIKKRNTKDCGVNVKQEMILIKAGGKKIIRCRIIKNGIADLFLVFWGHRFLF